MTSRRELEGVLYPVGDNRVVLIHHARDAAGFEAIAGVALKAVLAKVAGRGGLPSSCEARLFTTTPEIEQLLSKGRTYGAASAPGHFLPVVLDENRKYLRQVPLKEVDPVLLNGAAGPNALATAAALGAIAQRLAVIEELIHDIKADVEEILDRWDARQRGQLRAVLNDLSDFTALATSISAIEWGIVQGHRTALMELHSELVEELQRHCGRLRAHDHPTRRWSTITERVAERIDTIVRLELLVLTGLDQWTSLYLQHRPNDRSASATRQSALNRVDEVRREATAAFSLLPIDPTPNATVLGSVLMNGPIRANRELDKARRHHRITRPAIASAHHWVTAQDMGHPLKLLPATQQLLA
ncbi:hypothetical protein [Luteipulveratus flavus]|uniref:Uncharacterized protein n=1 Tax=Luteipulveratus flavus TaxID=3031728 RepID=A0ABT6C1I7_9MICO|nr:hypothetical protein [Luteipulveratus sp. YIM 133296]MDF8262711.1 hypothetical protein [Luteipulveratus sp. YIM 133296]